MIVDASVILSAYFPDEDQERAQTLIREHVMGHVVLLAPSLLLYEVTNAVVQALRRGRIGDAQAESILTSFEGLAVELRAVDWADMLALARRFDRSAYDAAYLALGQASGNPVITGDRRLYNAVRDQLEWVHWIGDYSPDTYT
jgi:predicted nucleic acid-binding protein